jgi:hypothetical protein
MVGSHIVDQRWGLCPYGRHLAFTWMGIAAFF